MQQQSLKHGTEHLLQYQDQIRVDYLKKHLSVIAHDSLRGRETGSSGLEIAADYLATEYRDMGLQPMGDEDSYFQHFSLSALKRDSTVYKLFENGTLVNRSVESRNQTANFIRSFGGSDTLSGEVIFAGFGVNDPGRGVRHLGDMDLEGKWVMVFQQIPHVVDGDTLVDPSINGKTRFSTIIEEKGAAGMLIVAPMTETEYQATAEKNRVRYAEPSRYQLGYLDDSTGGLPMGYNMVQPLLAARILGISYSNEKLMAFQQSLINNIRGFSPRKTGFSLTHIPHHSRSRIHTKNVVAKLPGSDPQLADEVVVLTSHYDHVGVGRPDSTGDSIYNGADDDGSGTVALLNVAKALSEARNNGYAPRRSILFLHVSAEEIGLYGSRYYSDHPVVPIDQTVANINIDMIGRIDREHETEGISDYAYLIGGELISSDLDSLIRLANRQSGNIELDNKYNDLDDPNQFYRRSDHWNFGRHRVPFAFFFSGVHEDYHRPSDEIHKIRFDKMAGIIRTIFASTVIIANEDQRPAVDNEAFIEITRSRPR